MGCNGASPVCREEANECDIQCGAGEYRHGHHCYHCSTASSDGERGCAECDGAGLCRVCKAGYGMRRGECRSMEQIALDRVAAELGEGCTSPDIETCLESRCSGRGECGTFDVELDLDTRAVLTLLVNAIQHCNNHIRLMNAMHKLTSATMALTSFRPRSDT